MTHEDVRVFVEVLRTRVEQAQRLKLCHPGIPRAVDIYDILADAFRETDETRALQDAAEAERSIVR